MSVKTPTHVVDSSMGTTLYIRSDNDCTRVRHAPSKQEIESARVSSRHAVTGKLIATEESHNRHHPRSASKFHAHPQPVCSNRAHVAAIQPNSLRRAGGERIAVHHASDNIVPVRADTTTNGVSANRADAGNSDLSTVPDPLSNGSLQNAAHLLLEYQTSGGASDHNFSRLSIPETAIDGSPTQIHSEHESNSLRSKHKAVRVNTSDSVPLAWSRAHPSHSAPPPAHPQSVTSPVPPSSLRTPTPNRIVELRPIVGDEEPQPSPDAGLVIYISSCGIVRQPFARCAAAFKILQTHRIHTRVRDLVNSRQHQTALRKCFPHHYERALHTRHVPRDAKFLPQLFLDGEWIGSLEELVDLNETGLIKEMFKHVRQRTAGSGSSTCGLCGDFRWVTCPQCLGTRKSQKVDGLKCTACQKGGVIPCACSS